MTHKTELALLNQDLKLAEKLHLHHQVKIIQEKIREVNARHASNHTHYGDKIDKAYKELAGMYGG